MNHAPTLKTEWNCWPWSMVLSIFYTEKTQGNLGCGTKYHVKVIKLILTNMWSTIFQCLVWNIWKHFSWLELLNRFEWWIEFQKSMVTMVDGKPRHIIITTVDGAVSCDDLQTWDKSVLLIGQAVLILSLKNIRYVTCSMPSWKYVSNNVPKFLVNNPTVNDCLVILNLF